MEKISNFSTIENTSKIYYNGASFKTKEGYEITVVGKSPNIDQYYVQFDAGNIISVNFRRIKSGTIKNPMHKSVCGVGYLGTTEFKKVGALKEYTLWLNMIRRCYALQDTLNKAYIDCTVDPEWCCFSTFYEDVKHLKDYDKWLSSGKYEYVLDKDIKIPGNRVYSKESCMFVKLTENAKASVKGRQHICEGVNLKTNEKIVFSNMLEFATKYGFDTGHISHCVSGKRKTHKGWSFRKIEGEHQCDD